MSAIPLPSSRLGTRIVLPLLVVGSALAILAWSSWRAWAPLTIVNAQAVIVRTSSITAGANASASASPSASASQMATGPVIQAPGWIEPSPFPISASALTPGVIREVLVLEGDHVEEGQVVARLIDDQEKIELRRASAEVDIKSADAAVLRDELTRKSKLVAGGAVSAAEVARLALRVQAADALVEQVRAMKDQAALTLARTEIRAPAAGLVMARLVAPGSFVGMDAIGAAVVQIFNPKMLQVRTDVPLSDAGRLAVGQTATIQVDSQPGLVIQGRVLRLVQLADIAKNTLQVKVLINDPPPGLVPDMLARVKIQTGAAASDQSTTEGRAEIAAPAAALTALVAGTDGRRSGSVRVVIDMRDHVGRIELREVVCAAQADAQGWTTVYEGLRPGDVVVLDDSPPTKPGARVRVQDQQSGEAMKGAHDGH